MILGLGIHVCPRSEKGGADTIMTCLIKTKYYPINVHMLDRLIILDKDLVSFYVQCYKTRVVKNWNKRNGAYLCTLDYSKTTFIIIIQIRCIIFTIFVLSISNRFYNFFFFIINCVLVFISYNICVCNFTQIFIISSLLS